MSTLVNRVRSMALAVESRLRWSGSARYWERRYALGGTSGRGSYGQYAEMKAGIVNRMVREREVTSVIELGCGDGNQLAYLDLEDYIGLDVSATAVTMCIERFRDDSRRKSFFQYSPRAFHDAHGLFVADLALSQEVVFHLVEDEVFDGYMRLLFSMGRRFVLICSSDRDLPLGPHERHRRFTPWVEQHAAGWKLAETAPSPHPYDERTGEGLLSDFFLYERLSAR
jgi:SAM-dependent methyltransferase